MVVPIGAFAIKVTGTVSISIRLTGEIKVKIVIGVIIIGRVDPAITIVPIVGVERGNGETRVRRVTGGGLVGDDHAVAGGQYSGDEHQAYL